MKKNYKKIVIPVIAVGAVGAVAIGSRFLLKGNEKGIKVGEITSNAIDSMNSAICSAINKVHDYEKSLDDLWMSKEEFGAATGLTGEKLDEYYGYYVEGIEEGDSEETAYNTVLNIATFNGDITPAKSGDGTTETGDNSGAEVADNSKPGSTGNNNSGGNGNSGNGNGGSSSSNNTNNSQNQYEDVPVRSPEEAQAWLESQQPDWIVDGIPSDPLTDEERAAEEAAMEGLHGF